MAGGQYVRNGGNPVANDDLGRAAHWFDGDGMLSGVLFRRTGEKGTAIQPEFVNQFLITDVYAYASRRRGSGPAAAPREGRRASRCTGRGPRRPVLPSIATLVNPCAGVLAIAWAVLRTIALVVLSHLARTRYPIRKISVANTSVVFHDGRALALCESGPPLRFALPGLETIGWFDGRTAENEPAARAHRLAGGRGGFGGGGALSFMREWTTAHPRVDPVTKELIAFHAVFVRPFCYYSIVPPSDADKLASSSSFSASSSSSPLSSPRFSMPVPGVRAPKMMHDFGASRNHTVILDLPLTLDPANLARGVPVLSYDSAGVSRFGVFPRYRPDRVRWFETSPCVIFHTANCWDTTAPQAAGAGGGGGAEAPGTTVHLLACRLTSASLIFSAGDLPTPAVKPVPPEYAEEEQCRLYYYSFPLSRSSSGSGGSGGGGEGEEDEDEDEPGPGRIRHQWALTAIPFEFPTLSPSRSMGPARYVYGCSTAGGPYGVALGKAAKVDHLAKVDALALIERGVRAPPRAVRGCVDGRTVAEVAASGDPDDPVKLFRMPDGWFAQEPRFVPRGEGAGGGGTRGLDEDDGWLLTYAFDESQLVAGECGEGAASELWVIDARTMRDVVARIKLPQRVPYGLHGAWFGEDEVGGQRPYEGTRTLPEDDDDERLPRPR